jgi:hypothetical protein
MELGPGRGSIACQGPSVRASARWSRSVPPVFDASCIAMGDCQRVRHRHEAWRGPSRVHYWSLPAYHVCISERDSPDELVLRRKKKKGISSEERVYLSIDMGNRGVVLVSEGSASHSLAFFRLASILVLWHWHCLDLPFGVSLRQGYFFAPLYLSGCCYGGFSARAIKLFRLFVEFE